MEWIIPIPDGSATIPTKPVNYSEPLAKSFGSATLHSMLKYDIQRAKAVAQVFTAQELDWILERLPADSTDQNQQRILDVLSEAFSLAVDQE